MAKHKRTKRVNGQQIRTYLKMGNREESVTLAKAKRWGNGILR